MLFITIGLSPHIVEEHLLLIKSEQLLPFTSTHFLFADWIAALQQFNLCSFSPLWTWTRKWNVKSRTFLNRFLLSHSPLSPFYRQFFYLDGNLSVSNLYLPELRPGSQLPQTTLRVAKMECNKAPVLADITSCKISWPGAVTNITSETLPPLLTICTIIKFL